MIKSNISSPKSSQGVSSSQSTQARVENPSALQKIKQKNFKAKQTSHPQSFQQNVQQSRNQTNSMGKLTHPEQECIDTTPQSQLNTEVLSLQTGVNQEIAEFEKKTKFPH